ncbi:MAG: hypothetical protein HQL70_09460 [Magnetococcales bacterium]|nr:hypothetical protein [Magnetococcales bacterium]
MLFGLSANLLWSTPLLAFSCKSSSVPVKISTRFVKAVPVIDNNASQRRLNKKHRSRRDSTQTIGMTESGLFIRVTTSFAIKSFRRSKKSCVALHGVKVEYGFGSTPVLIDKQFRPGSCEYRAIYDHEIEHVRIMNSKGRSYNEWIHKQMSYRLKSITQRLTTRPNQEQRRITGRVKKIAASLMRKLNNSLSVAHAYIDTPESYRKTQAKCSGWK